MGSCVEILCLRAALRFDINQQGFPLREQRLLTRSDVLAQPQLGLLSPLFGYAQRLAELEIDETEAALMAATWILQVYTLKFLVIIKHLFIIFDNILNSVI